MSEKKLNSSTICNLIFDLPEKMSEKMECLAQIKEELMMYGAKEVIRCLSKEIANNCWEYELCPHCFAKNVYSRGDGYICHTCGRTWEEY